MTDLRIVFLGLSITSSWGNGHATTYRGLVRELVRRGHDVLFLERDTPYYAENRDLPQPPYGRTELYRSLEELTDRFAAAIRAADCVVLGSFVAEGVWIGDWIRQIATGCRAFYDIDTPVTLRALRAGGSPYLEPRQIPEYDLYLSFTGGPMLTRLRSELGARRAEALYCSVDPEAYFPTGEPHEWDLGYLGTYSRDRQPALDSLLLTPAREWPSGRFAVAGPQYPTNVQWPANVERTEHVAPPEHRSFYNRQRFTLNITREDMVVAGHSPSVRLFEAAASGTPIVSDLWRGIDQFFEPGKEILLARTSGHVLSALQDLSDDKRRALGENARKRVLSEHTSAHRAETFERYVLDAAAHRRKVARSPRFTPMASTPSGGQS
jgi:spore maturation protein CgeB